MLRDKTLAIDLPDFYSRLYMDFVAGKVDGLEPAHLAFSDSGLWPSLAEQALSSCRATAKFWHELETLNRRLGAADRALKGIEKLAGGGCVVVVGGQQPGLLGGALLVLYKAATIVALAEHFEKSTGTRCAPVFIVSGDDSDFVETSHCTLFDGSLRRLGLAFSSKSYEAGRMVGALSVKEESDLGASLMDSVGDPPGRKFVKDLVETSAGSAGDHGEFVGAMLSRLFSDEGLIVLDGRSAEMRRVGGGLFASYLSRREELTVAVRAKGRELERRGYHAQLSGPGLEWWLFKVEEGIRKKSGEGGATALEAALSESPESLTPNVALRPLWRDSTLPSVFGVLGASEVAYTLQLSEAYKMLGVPPRGLFPRLCVTAVPAEGELVAGGWGGRELDVLLNDFEGAVKSHYRRLVPKEAVEALDAARGTVGRSLGELERTLEGISGRWGKAARSVGQASEKGLSRLGDDMVDALRRDSQKDNPRLKGLGEFLLPDGRPQERTVSMLMPMLEEGASFVERVMDMAREHVVMCSSGRVCHYCYRLGDGRGVEDR